MERMALVAKNMWMFAWPTLLSRVCSFDFPWNSHWVQMSPIDSEEAFQKRCDELLEGFFWQIEGSEG